MPPRNQEMSKEKVFEWGFKIVGVLIIPILLWVNNLTVQLAISEEKSKGYQQAAEEVPLLKSEVALLKQSLSSVKQDLDKAGKHLEEIQSLLMRQYLAPPSPSLIVPRPSSATPTP